MGWNVGGYKLNHRWLLGAGPTAIPPPKKGPLGLPMLPLIQAHLKGRPLKFPLFGPPGEAPPGVPFAAAPLIGKSERAGEWGDIQRVVEAA